MAKKETKKVEVKKVVSKDSEHEARLKRLNPDFDPSIPEQKQRWFRQ